MGIQLEVRHATAHFVCPNCGAEYSIRIEMDDYMSTEESGSGRCTLRDWLEEQYEDETCEDCD